MQFLELQKLSDLDLDLASGRSYTGAHVRLRSTHTPDYVQIAKNFVDGQTDTSEFQSRPPVT